MIRSKLAIILVFLLVATGSFAQSLKPLKGISIMLDPGHGGADPGAVGPTGLKESAVNLRVARYLRDLLVADGAEVSMTRDRDTFLSLAQRVEAAANKKPDLFVSIHHNASLAPVRKNRSEIYYNAMDTGISKSVGEKMTAELQNYGYGEESVMIPAGFFVLRNNTSPSILTEAGYISIPEVEKGLKTGKALTNQAQALRRAIRDYFKDGVLRVKFIIADDPIKINTPFFNLIFSSSKEISRVHARLSNDKNAGFGFDSLPSVGYTYRLYNTAPLASGNYELQLTFSGPDGSYSSRTILKLQVSLPFANSSMEPVAPFIPTGFKGKFPVKVTLKDDQGRLNTRSVPVALFYGNDSASTGITSEKGETTLYLDLDGRENADLSARLVIDKEIVAQTTIPVKTPQRRYFLGRIVTPSGTGVQGVKINYGLKNTVISGPDGYFYCDTPMIYGNLKLDLVPPLGYEKTSCWLRTSGEPVSLPIITLKPVSETLLGKKLAIMAPMSFDNLIRRLVKPLMTAGAEVIRLNLPESQARPEYQAVLEANLRNDLDILLSFKREVSGSIMLRHYHRGGRGKKLADAVKFSLASDNPPLDVKVAAGSDYEIGHTGLTAVVFAFPEQMPPDYPEKLIAHLAQVLRTGF
jgi:N-acetylmuramoyl-L-alanine amidase